MAMTIQYHNNTPLPEPHDGKSIAQYQLARRCATVRENRYWRWLLLEECVQKNTQPLTQWSSEVEPPTAFQSLILLPNDNLVEQESRNPNFSQQKMISVEPLILPYMQAMCAALCFTPAELKPRVLQFGLGGGSMNRFLLANDLIQSMVSFESDQLIADIYRQWFSLMAIPAYRSLAKSPLDASIDDVVVHDAANFQSNYSHRADIVLIDLFSSQGLPSVLSKAQFYSALSQNIGEKGVIALNSYTRDMQLLQPVFNAIRSRFKHLLFAEIPGYENIIVYASNSELKLSSQHRVKMQMLLSVNIDEHFGRAISV